MTELTMLPWRYIQRMSLQERCDEDQAGFSRWFDFDYMGSSEFEWGAVPKALKILREGVSEFAITKIGNVGAWVFHHPALSQTDIANTLEALGADKIRCKERHNWDARFDTCVSDADAKSYKLRTDTWLVLHDYPVIWTCNAKAATKIRNELTKQQPTPAGQPAAIDKPVAEDELRVFDQIEFYHHGKVWEGQVVGIYQDHLTVKIGGNRQNVSYNNVRRIIK